MLQTEIGFRPAARVRSWAKIREQLGTYVLFSEFALDLPGPLPESLSTVQKAEALCQGTTFAACERMRTATDLREGYVQLALESGALRVLVPLANKAQFAGLPEEVVEKLDIVFYGDVDRAMLKTLEM